jgi:hypothetical protein
MVDLRHEINSGLGNTAPLDQSARLVFRSYLACKVTPNDQLQLQQSSVSQNSRDVTDRIENLILKTAVTSPTELKT